MVKTRIGLVWPNYTNPGCTDWWRHDEAKAALKRELEKDGFNRRCEFVDLFLVPEYLENGKKPTKTLVKKHSEAFEKDLSEAKPDYLVAFGSKSFEFTTELRKITEWAGREVESQFGYPLIPIFHPDQMVSYPARGREFVSQMAAMRRIARDASREINDDGWEYVDTLERALQVLARCSQADFVTFDYETTGLVPYGPDQYIRCVGLSPADDEAYCIDFADDKVKDAFAHWLGHSHVPKVAFNYKYEYTWSLVILGVEPRNFVGDPMLLHIHLQEEAGHKLEVLAYQYTDLGGYDTELKRQMANGATYADVDMEYLWYYCCGDVVTTRILHQKLTKEQKAHPYNGRQRWNYKNITLPSSSLLARVEANGMYIDRAAAKNKVEELAGQVEQLESDINNDPAVISTLEALEDPGPFNSKSPKQVRHLLYQELELPVTVSTKTGPSTKREVLEELAVINPLCQKIVDLRSVASDLTDLEGYIERIRPDGTINSNFRLDVAVTGRLSSSEPNLQNLSREGRTKSVFVSRFKGGKIGCADISQAEVRVLGSIAEEPVLIDAYSRGVDVHLNSAALMFGVKPEKITSDQRTQGKRTTFGVIYGIGGYRLAAQFGRPGDKAYGEQVLQSWFRAHPRVDAWMKSTVRFAEKNGFVINKLGRVRHLPLINDRDWKTKKRAERQATNQPIQSCVADIIMMTMAEVERRFSHYCLESLIIGQVHDSILVDIYPGEEKSVYYILKETMEDWANKKFTFLKIPLLSDVTMGPNYKQQEEYVA